MTNEISLRDYRANDIEAMFQLDELCFDSRFRFDRRSMRGFAEEGNALVRIAEGTCGKLAGFVIAHVEHVASEWRAYVVTLDVAAERRRQGLAGKLMQAAEESAIASGVRWMYLHVFTGNEPAIRFYERIGYVRIRTRRGFYGGPGLDAFVYGKELQRL
jgi:[ribosomal protein S18]-alanine N-acetyltransferase